MARATLPPRRITFCGTDYRIGDIGTEME